METIIRKKKKAVPKGAPVFKKMMEDKKYISTHLKNGGSLDELKKKGYRFAAL